MGTLPHGIGYYLDGFNKAANKSTQEGADFFIRYVKDQIEAGVNVGEAFDVCVGNLFVQGRAFSMLGGVNDECLSKEQLASINLAREIMAEELAQ